MYDWPALRPAQDAFYAQWRAAMAARGLAAPSTLCWQLPPSQLWARDDLFVAQTCAFPFVSGLCGNAQLVATPCYELPHCQRSEYRSVVVAAASLSGACLQSFESGVLAVNSANSYSGHWALLRHLNSLDLSTKRPKQSASPLALSDFFASIHTTGSHLASMQAVAADEAQLAAIDCVLWAHAQHAYPKLRDALCVIDRTTLAPGLPFITSGQRSEGEVTLMRETLLALLKAPSREGWQQLRIADAEIHPLEYYQRLKRYLG